MRSPTFKRFLKLAARDERGASPPARLCAGALILAADTGRYLVAKRSHLVDHPGTWATWGGAVEPGETPAEAVEREIWEETRYSGPLDLEELFTAQGPNQAYVNFLAVVPGEFRPKLNWETSAYRWVLPGRWPTPLHPGLEALGKWLASHRGG
jgi:8-oxo-dGTP pyrophosphatase MutT (NUDIX family)